MDVATLFILILLAGLLGCSGFFSGSETALFSLTRHERGQLTGRDDPVSNALATLLGETRGLLVTLLMGNMTINVAYFAVCSLLLLWAERDGAGPLVLVLLTVVPLLVMILLGEVLPKLVASRKRTTWVRVVALPLLLVHRVLAPGRAVVGTGFVEPLARLLAPSRQRDTLTADEIDRLAHASREQNLIGDDEQKVLSQVLELSRMKVRELMVPRVDMIAHDLDGDPAELIERFRTTRLRHLPACRGDLDNIAGVLHARQVLLERPDTRAELEPLVRQVHIIPELQRADRLLAEMRKTGNTFAIVVDEYGGTAGLITLEDLVEHIVGDIPGAYETSGELSVEPVVPDGTPAGADAEPDAADTAEAAYLVDGGLLLVDWPDRLADVPPPDFENHAEDLDAVDVDTLGGLVLSLAGRLPDVGDSVELGPLRFTVMDMENRRILRVRIDYRPEADDPEGGGDD